MTIKLGASQSRLINYFDSRLFVFRGDIMFKRKIRNCIKTTDVVSPINGLLIPIEDVNDPTFSEKIMGDGIAIKPSSDTVVAPCVSKVIMISETKHAIGLETPDGVQIIIHIGLDTVERKGNGFEIVCKLGDVNPGDPLVEFDRLLLEEEGVDTTVILIFIDKEGFKLNHISKYKEVNAGTSIVTQLVNEEV